MIIVLGWLVFCASVGVYGLYTNDLLDDEIQNIRSNLLI